MMAENSALFPKKILFCYWSKTESKLCQTYDQSLSLVSMTWHCNMHFKLLGRQRAVLGIRDPDPHLWLIDPDPDAKKYIFLSHFFLSTCRRYILFCLKINFFVKFCVKILFCRHYFSPLNTFMRKRKDPEPDPDPHLWLMYPARKV